MNNPVRIFVEKKEGFRVEAESLKNELSESLGLKLTGLRLLNVYDIKGFTPELLEKCRYSVFGEIVTDNVYDSLDLDGSTCLAVEYLPGQFDQRASSAIDCVHLIDPNAGIDIKSSRLLIFSDPLSGEDFDAIRHYYINAVESREKDLGKSPFTDIAAVRPLRRLDGFLDLPETGYKALIGEWGLAMNEDDLREVQKYFRSEGRPPRETELRILDTYWSDHCRHTTFTTELTEIKVDDSFIREEIESELGRFHDIRSELGRTEKPLCLMELATIGARYLKSKGLLDDMEVSEENNACSILVDVDEDGKREKWLLQFKNETHNHPTEIEPFGGAATCLGGAIRDPLSGRAYVYQAMRVTGAGDILKPVSETLPGKLPQKVISRKAAAGYSSYGNQIGLATTHVREIYHPGYTAKRLEIGAVVGAVKADHVRRESPAPGDVILLLGGRTGRDGIGGATGSSKEHNESSLETCGSEVQKGNAPEERKLQRLFRHPEVTRLIKKSNDFGAGGVSVAIGELAPGLDIRLEAVPVKYSGLNATELAISESQERMAVVVEKKDREEFERWCSEENVEVSYVADVTDTGRMRMFYNGETVADLSREFIDSAGARHFAKATVGAVEKKNPFEMKAVGENLEKKWQAVMGGANIASQKGLAEMFDSTIGRSTVLLPYGGITRDSETQVSVQKLPTDGFTRTASVMAFGYNPELMSWSPYHGAAYSVVEACSKVVAAGADWRGMRFSYQEYFERMTSDPHSWGKPLAALLGTLKMQDELGLPSIGGKDSMSGTFGHINVPPTLVAFGITTMDTDDVVSPEFKREGDKIYLVKHNPLANGMPDTAALRENWSYIRGQISDKHIKAAWAVGFGGVGEGLAKMAFGNGFGVNVNYPESVLFNLDYGSVIVESDRELTFRNAVLLGEVTESGFAVNGEKISPDALREAWKARYEKVYPKTARARFSLTHTECTLPAEAEKRNDEGYKGAVEGKPKVFMPVFPGTNCDYDTAKAFRKAGAEVRFEVFRNLDAKASMDSIDAMAKGIDECQIFALSGGFSVADEPDGSGKFIAGVLNNSKIATAVTGLLDRGGLILGICNGFQALVKSGLLPYGRLGCVCEESPTLFRNDINRHISQMVVTRVGCVSSPWLEGMKEGELHSIAVSHGEGKFVVNDSLARKLFANGQVAFQYADPESGEPTMESPYNPNGSYWAIEGIVSPDGHILGKMGHSERYEPGTFRNICENREQALFENAVKYFKR